MMTILNRLRGTYSWMSKVNGVVLGLLCYLVYGNYYVAIAVAIGYIAGESFGWGDWIGTLAENSYLSKPEPYEEGKSNGIQWLATKIIKPETDWHKHCEVALTIRGFYWWFLTLCPLFFVADSVLVIIAILLLSIGFPIACELGYYFRDKISFEKYGLSYIGGWELQEGFYGLMQDLVLIGGICYVMV